MRHLTRILIAILASVALVALPVPARACACGAAIPDGGAAFVRGETAMVRWDGTTETIDMVLQFQGEAKSAAWIMPTPQGATFGLGDRTVFERLNDATKPQMVTKTRWKFFPDNGDGAGAAPASGVDVEKVTTVGPFEITTLAGSSAEAVNSWLTENGYPTKPEIVPTLQTYLDKGWRIQATRLLPGSTGMLSGDLQPLQMEFATTEPVYPMALSKHAKSHQQVLLYLVSDREMTITQQAGSGRLPRAFAGFVQASIIDPGLSGELYVTKFAGGLAPQNITSDFTFAYAATNDPHRETYTVYVTRGEWIGPTALGVLGVVVLGVLIGYGYRRARR